MNILKEYKQIIIEMYGPFYTPKKLKEEFMNKVREKVEYYQPKIEEKCKLQLGEIKVKDQKDFLQDMFTYSLNAKYQEEMRKEGKNPTIMNNIAHAISLSIAYGIIWTPLKIYTKILSNAEYRFFNNTIYTEFSWSNRFLDMDFKKRTEHIDYGIMHELSHGIWDKITNNNEGHLGLERVYYEGFATYCSDNYFSNLYPHEIQRLNVPPMYNNGKKKIEEIIAKYGEEIILEIPKNWKKLDKEIN